MLVTGISTMLAKGQCDVKNPLFQCYEKQQVSSIWGAVTETKKMPQKMLTSESTYRQIDGWIRQVGVDKTLYISIRSLTSLGTSLFESQLPRYQKFFAFRGASPTSKPVLAFCRIFQLPFCPSFFASKSALTVAE